MASPIIRRSQRKGKERDRPTDSTNDSRGASGAVGPPTTHTDAIVSETSPIVTLFKSLVSGRKPPPPTRTAPFAAVRRPSVTKAGRFDSPHFPNRIPERMDVPAKGSIEPNIGEKEKLELITSAIDTLRQLSEIDELVLPTAMEMGLGKVSYVLSILKQRIRNEVDSEDLTETLDSHERVFDQEVARIKADDLIPDPRHPLLDAIKQYSVALERLTAAIINTSGPTDKNALRGTRWERAKAFSSKFPDTGLEKTLPACVPRLSTALDEFMVALERYKSFILTEMSAEMLLGNRKPGYAYQMTSPSSASNDDDIILAGLRLTGLQSGSRLPGCTGDTRKSILKQIEKWTTNFDAPNILWLKGPLGVGKSAIATTVVQQLNKSGRLGSNFFFQRQEAAIMTPSALWRTVAYDLAEKYPMVRSALVSKLRDGKFMPTTINIDDLFLHFIHEPLSESEEGIPDGQLPIIVIDALDECGGLDGSQSEHRRSLMRTLKSWARLSGKFKLIVTSQDDKDIREVFSTTSHHPIEIFAGHKRSSEDIKIFVTEQLQQVAVRHAESAPSDWLRLETIDRLVNSAGGLFIWAETVVKFVDLGEPALRLSQVLAGEVNGNMAALYRKILEISFPNSSDQENFRYAVGTIILAKAPLSPSSLAHLLSMEIQEVDRICNDLQPLMDSRANFLRIHHQSFVDFLIEPAQCPPPFLVERKRENRNLTLACLQVMNNHLRFNICNLKSSYNRNVDILDLASRIKEFVPPYLSYSSFFWASHLAETPYDVDLFDRLQWFMQNQFLFWLEILSIIKRADLASSILSLLIGWIPSHDQDNTLAMAIDMQKFEAVFAPVISCSAPHIYLSALPFSPQNSAVSRQYMQDYPRTLGIQAGGLRNWLAIPTVFSGHKNWVWSVAFSPDGKRIVSGSDDRTIRVWNVETGETVGEPFKGHSDSVWSVAFSPDGERIVSGSSDMQVRIWNAKTGEEVAGPFEGHKGAVSSVTFSPDGAYIASGSKDKTIRVWDSQKGTAVGEPFKGHNGSVWSVAFSPDGERIVSGSSDMQVRVWNAKTGEEVAGPFKGHENWVNSVAFSPDGIRVISGSDDKTIRVWDAGKSEVGEMIAGPFTGHNDYILSIAVSPNGKQIISGSRDQAIMLWDARKSGVGEMITGPFIGHTGAIISVAFSPDGQSLAGAQDETVRVWNNKTGMTVACKGHTDLISSVEFSRDGAHIVSASRDTTIRVWGADTGTMLAVPFRGHDEDVRSAKFSPDGKRIVSGSNDTTIRVWDVKTGKTVVGPLRGHTDGVRSVAFSPNDGTRVVSGSYDGTIRVWNAEKGEIVAGPFELHGGPVFSVAFSPNGKRIVYGSYVPLVSILDATTGEIVAGPYEGHSDWIRSIAFSPDGKCVVSGSDDGTIRVWDAEPGVAMKPLEGHSDCVSSVAYSPNGEQIVSGSLDKKVRVWNAATGEAVAGPFEGHRGPVSSVAFSPDGKRITSGSGDQEIRVWNAEPGGAIKPFEGHDDWVCSAAFSADGKHIVSGSGDKTVRVWNAETGEAVGGPLKGHNGPVNCVRLSTDGKRIASGSDDNTVRVWDAKTGAAVELLEGHSGPVWGVAFSPDGECIVSGSKDNTIRVWDARTGAVVAGPFNGHNGDVWSVDFSPDGMRVVSGSHDKTIRVWNAKTGEVAAGPFKGHDGAVLCVAFSLDGTFVVSGSEDSEIRVWNVETGKPRAVCTGHSAQVNSVAFSPNGNRIVSASHDETVRVWNAETGEAVAGPFKGHSGFVASIAFSRDERCIASGSVDKTIRVWDVTIGDPEIDQSSQSFTDDSTMEDGWILGSDSELLFWVPPTLRTGLRWPRTLLVIAKDIPTKLDLKSFVHGEFWHLCLVSLPGTAAGTMYESVNAVEDLTPNPGVARGGLNSIRRPSRVESIKVDGNPMTKEPSSDRSSTRALGRLHVMSITWNDRFAILFELFTIGKAASIPTLKATLWEPQLIVQPGKLRALFFENVWKFMGDSVDEAGRETKVDLLPRATGIVLEIGAGHGHSCQYLDLTKVTRYIALEPNPLMHETLVTNAVKAGFSPERIQIIGCGAEDTTVIIKALDGEQVDTIISILSLCGIPDAESSLARMARDVLKPGGKLLFYEHVQCDPSPTMLWWQKFWTPLWQAVLGCRLDKPTHLYVERLDLWEQREVWGKLPNEEPSLWWHQVGCYVKKASSER